MQLDKWEELGERIYVGKTITGVRYLTKEEAEQIGLYQRAPVLRLSNGVEIFPLRDDECNSAGALGQLFYDDKEQRAYTNSILPTASLNHEEYVAKLYAEETKDQAEKRHVAQWNYMTQIQAGCKPPLDTIFGKYAKDKRGKVTLHIYDIKPFGTFRLLEERREDLETECNYWGEIEIDTRLHALLKDGERYVVGVFDQQSRTQVGHLKWIHTEFSLDRIFTGANMLEEFTHDEFFLQQLEVLTKEEKDYLEEEGYLCQKSR